LRVVLLTRKCSHGTALLRHMSSKNISLNAILFERPEPYERVRHMKRLGLVQTARIIVGRVLKTLMARAKPEWLSNEFYYSYSNKVYVVDNFNGKQCERFLMELKPDLILLGFSTSRILKQHIINIPRIGILNAHPGLLPKYRGLDPIEWAIHNGDDIGVTIHFVDKGVDTGGIVIQKVINIEKDDTIESLRRKAGIVAGELMTKTIIEIMDGEHIQVTPQSKEDGQQYHRMSGKLLRETERKLNGIKRSKSRGGNPGKKNLKEV